MRIFVWPWKFYSWKFWTFKTPLIHYFQSLIKADGTVSNWYLKLALFVICKNCENFVIVRHLIQVSSRCKCPNMRWHNDITETEMQHRFLLHHYNTSYEGIYTLKAPCMKCLTLLENGSICSHLLTDLS